MLLLPGCRTMHAPRLNAGPWHRALPTWRRVAGCVPAHPLCASDVKGAPGRRASELPRARPCATLSEGPDGRIRAARRRRAPPVWSGFPGAPAGSPGGRAGGTMNVRITYCTE